MSYCINPWCGIRYNSGSVPVCTCGTPLKVNNRYRLLHPLRPLSNSSYANYEIFEVQDLHQNGARKVLKTLIRSDDFRLRAYFEREVEVLLSLDSDPRIPRCEDHGEVILQNSIKALPYLVMEFIEGLNLHEWIQNHEKIQDYSKALNWLKQLTTILDDIHANGLLHRDIKPSNIMLRSDGESGKELVLIDFGFSRRYDAQSLEDLSYVGTHDYIAPEVESEMLRGETPAPASTAAVLGRIDFFSLGRTFVYLLTGKQPSAQSLQEWQWYTAFPRPQLENPASPESQLINLINDLMARSPIARPQSAAAILSRIDEIRRLSASQTRLPVFDSPSTAVEPVDRSTPLPLTPSPPAKSVNRWRELRPSIGIISLVVLVLALLGLLWRSTACGGSILNCPPKIADEPPPPPEEPDTPSAPNSIAALVSAGEKSLVPLDGDYGQRKEDGIRQFAAGDYRGAIETFDRIRADAKTNQLPGSDRALKDPEILIYRNNAEVRRRYLENEEPSISTIAVAAPVTDKNGVGFATGQQILFGVAQIQNDVVNGGARDQSDVNPQLQSSGEINGKQLNLEVVIANDRNSEADGQAVATALTGLQLDDDPNDGQSGERKIQAVVGHYGSTITCAALPIYDDAALVTVSPISTLTDLRKDCAKDPNDETPNEIFFRTTSSNAVDALTLVEYLQEQQQNPRVAVFYHEGEKFSEDLLIQFKELLEARGGTVIPLPLSGAFTVEEALAQIEDATALAVFPDGKTETAEIFDRSTVLLREYFRITPPDSTKPVLASNTLLSQEAIFEILSNPGTSPSQAANLVAEGLEKLTGKLVLSVDWHQNVDNCFARQEFVDGASALWGGGINRTAALSYEAVQVLLTPLQQDPSAKVQPIALEQANVNSGIFRGKKITFDEEGDRREIDTRILVTPGPDSQGNRANPVFNPLKPNCL